MYNIAWHSVGSPWRTGETSVEARSLRLSGGRGFLLSRDWTAAEAWHLHREGRGHSPAGLGTALLSSGHENELREGAVCPTEKQESQGSR